VVVLWSPCISILPIAAGRATSGREGPYQAPRPWYAQKTTVFGSSHLVATVSDGTHERSYAAKRDPAKVSQ
jgi:hypothetical protein